MKPFEVSWTPEEFDTVRGRVAAYEFAPAPDGEGWTTGSDPAFLRRLQDHWLKGYDRLEALERLNRFSQFRAVVDGVGLHFVHLLGESGGRRPLLMTHGWPGSFREFWRVAEPLAYPSRFGGRAEDAFDLVIPSLPNFGFSDHPSETVDQARTADLFDKLMREVLGYRTYRAHGGDWGALVTSLLALRHPQSLEGIHLTMIFPQPAGGPQGEAETEWAKRMEGIEKELGAYRHLQGSKPQSLSWLVGNDPMRQASWIVERYHDWSDRRERSFEEVFTLDELIDTAMIYHATGAFHTSIRYYSEAMKKGLRQLKPGERVEVPTAFACFPGDPLHPWPPRSYAERAFAVSRWTQMPQGGHFVALEAPELLVEDLRDWVRSPA
ncbi:epoxide hydrolase family protein [Aureimonas sp. AU40]|uniref:epoxide hydrolase family protein n=1 Tax=Aureimonas sp. AU40 TaxID=1637747 RepID=UPI000785F9CA|nr:epoxide hydrolase family protein [Aureimonas sp. AU40]